MNSMRLLIGASLMLVAVSVSAQATLVGITNHAWKYFAVAGGDPGAGWQGVGFDDSSWPTGRGLFGQDTGYPYPFVSTFPGGSAGGPAVAFFRTTFSWSGSTAGVVFTMTNYFDDGVVLYLNGAELTRFNMPAGPADHTTFAPGTLTEPVVRVHQLTLNNLTNGNLNPLVAGNNVLSASVHNNAQTSSDTVFGLSVVASQCIASGTDGIQPTNRTAIGGCGGRPVTFVVVPTGVPAPTVVQWYRDVGFGEELMVGQTGTSMTLTNVSVVDAGQYFARITGTGCSAGVVDSRHAVLTVLADSSPPQFLRVEFGSASNAFRLVVDRPLCTNSEACGSDATFQFNWQIVNISNPWDDLGVATVTNNGNFVDFTTSIGRTPGMTYKIVADPAGSGISDRCGNFVPPGYSITSLPQLNLKQGLNGYTGVEDTELEAGTASGGPDAVHGTTAFILVDQVNSGGESQALLRFNNVFGFGANQIPLGSEIVSAVIRMQHTQLNANGDPVNLHRMLVPWTQTVATWNNMNGNGLPGIQPDGIEAVASTDLLFNSFNQTVPFTLDLDVTSSLQAWSAGQANYGWTFISTGADGYRFDSSSVPTGPELIVFYRQSDGGIPVVLSSPVSTSVQEGAYVVFSASISNAYGNFQWQKNDVDIPGATGFALTLSNVQLSDAGAYRLVATNPGGSATTGAATLTVTPNTVRPVLTSAFCPDSNTIVLTFSKALNTATAQNAANYSFTPSLTVSNAILSGSTTVTVTTASRVFPTAHRLRISGLRDTFGSANLINLNPTEVDLTTVSVAGAYGDIWKYATNNLDGQAWTLPGYDDSPWMVGPGFFGFESSAAVTNSLPPPRIFTFIPPNGDSANTEAHVTSYYRRQVTLPALTAGTTYLMSHYTDDGAIFYLDGIEIGRYQMPAGVPTFVTRAITAGGNAEAVLQAFTFTASAGVHTLAVEVHQAGVTSGDVVFGANISAISLPTPLTISRVISGTNIMSWAADSAWQLVGSQNVEGNYLPVAGNPFRLFNIAPNAQTNHYFYRLRHRGQ